MAYGKARRLRWLMMLKIVQRRPDTRMRRRKRDRSWVDSFIVFCCVSRSRTGIVEIFRLGLVNLILDQRLQRLFPASSTILDELPDFGNVVSMWILER